MRTTKGSSFDRGQRMDQLPLLVFVGEDLKPFW